jgi:hypothetical protein
MKPILSMKKALRDECKDETKTLAVIAETVVIYSSPISRQYSAHCHLLFAHVSDDQYSESIR